MTDPESSALDLLLQRLTWPSGLVRERACVSLGTLLADAELGTEVASAVLVWMAAQRLESVVVFGLLAFFKAQTYGRRIPPWDVVCQRLSAPSLLSWLIASSVYEEFIGNPTVGDLHSGTAPTGFEAHPFFLKYAQAFVPPIYLEYARQIDQPNRAGFLGQWAFEWTHLVGVTGFKLRQPYVSFWTRQDDDHVGCLDLPLSEVYRSAFLRAIAWAMDRGRLSRAGAFRLVAETCPIDLGLWRVLPHKQPDTWPTCPRTGDSVDTLPGAVATELASMWQRQLAEEWLVAEASGRIQESGSSAYDLQITGVIQACTGTRTPDVNTHFAEEVPRTIRWQPEQHQRLAFGGSYGREPAKDWQEEHPDWLVWRLAAQADSYVVPRWQWWRFLRGVWLPSPILARKAFGFRCTEDAVVVEEDGCEVARWIDWTHELREMTTGNLTPSTGQMLLIRRSLVEGEADKLGGAFAWICKITTYNRKHSHSAFTEVHFVLDFGTTRIVRDRTWRHT